MDRRRLLFAALAAVAAPAARAGAADARLAALAHPAAPDGVLGVAVVARGPDGRVRFAEAHGRGVQGEGPSRRERPFTLDTPVRVASISKLVAMTGVMRLAEQGRLELDADVSRVLGWRLRHPAHPERAITAAMLASHTAGLRNGRDYPVPAGRRLRDVFDPGSAHWDDGSWFAPASAAPGAFAYADVNFAVLAQMIERVSGERFDRFMTRAVLAPFRLDAGYNWSGVTQGARERASACCRRQAGVWTPEVDAVVPPFPAARVLPAPERPAATADDVVPGENGFALSPQGGLRASVRDLDALARACSLAAHGEGGVVSGAGLQRMQRPVWTWRGEASGDTDGGLYWSYGLGVQIPTGRAGPRGDAFLGRGSQHWRGHLGEAYGLVSGMFWNVRDRRTLSWVINGTPRDAAAVSGARSSLSPWEEAAVDAGLRVGRR